MPFNTFKYPSILSDTLQHFQKPYYNTFYDVFKKVHKNRDTLTKVAIIPGHFSKLELFISSYPKKMCFRLPSGHYMMLLHGHYYAQDSFDPGQSIPDPIKNVPWGSVSILT